MAQKIHNLNQIQVKVYAKTFGFNTKKNISLCPESNK